MRTHGLLAVLTHDLPTKGIALGVALLLWAGVTFLGSQMVTIDNVPVSVINVPSDLGVSGGLSPVAVRVRVPRTISVGEEPARLVRALIDLEGSGLGERTVLVTVTPANPTVDVLTVTPSSLRVTLDPVVERTLPVRVIPTGTPTEGYRIGDVKTEPERVRVRGALGILEKTPGLDAAVSVEGATTSFDGEVPLVLPPGAQATPARVRVRVTIEQSEGTKTVGIRVITKGDPAPGYWVRTVTTDPSTVAIRGAREVVDRIAVLDTAPVDVSTAREAVETTVNLTVPEGVEVLDGEANVRARVDIAPLQGTKEVSASISTADVPDGLRVVSISPPTVRVTVRGEGEAFDQLRDEDVRIVVSAGGRERGSFTLQPSLDHVRAPATVRAVSVEAKTVTVTLESS